MGQGLINPRAEIQAFFDTQVKGIIGQIMKQLDWMQLHRNDEHVVTYFLGLKVR
jgi:predicted CoA-binding protein